jgi:single-strand DNA-binding protein
MHQIGLARIGRDAELRYASSGDAVVNLSLAYNWGKKDSDGNRLSQWIDASLWGKRAESLVEYLTKGTQILAVLSDGHIEEFERRDGAKGSKWVARVESIEFAGSRQSSDDGQERRAPSPAPTKAPATERKPAARSTVEDMDDDIPF